MKMRHRKREALRAIISGKRAAWEPQDDVFAGELKKQELRCAKRMERQRLTFRAMDLIYEGDLKPAFFVNRLLIRK